MKYIDDFRRQDLAKGLAAAIATEAQPDRQYHLMEFCGGHTHAIFRYGVHDLMPGNVHFVHGPGCPVCVLPMSRIDNAIELAMRPEVILTSYGDMMRVPAGKRGSLMKAKAAGADVRMIYSTQDALKIARANPDRQVVFFAIGFETTTPATAVAIKQAQAEGLTNFTVFCNHVLTPAAIQHILASPDVRDLGAVKIDGFLGPSHVSSIIGSQPYEYFAEEFQRPVVIAGFEPLDVMQSALMLIRQLNEGRHEVENQYARAVTREGNRKAQSLMADVLELRRQFEWRGLGMVPYSGLKIRKDYAAFDTEERFEVTPSQARDVKGCECPAILRGAKKPLDCKLFGTVCTPDNPIGSCMVSSEGACAAYWTYGRFRKPEHEDWQNREGEEEEFAGGSEAI
jgi:hydrogenase expression/formation protein HypD